MENKTQKDIRILESIKGGVTVFGYTEAREISIAKESISYFSKKSYNWRKNMNIKEINGKFECYFKELNLRYVVDTMDNAITIAFALGKSKKAIMEGKK